MTRRVKKPLIPPKKERNDSTSVTESEMKSLQKKLEKMYISTKDTERPAGTVLKIQRGHLSRCECRASIDTLRAIGVESGAVISLQGSFQGTQQVHIFYHKYVPFGLLEVSEDLPHTESDIVHVTPYEGYVIRLSRIYFQPVGTPGILTEELFTITEAKQKLIGKLVIDGMVSPCGKYTVHLEEDIDWGIIRETTQIRLYHPNTEPDSRFTENLSKAQAYLTRYFEKRSDESIGNALLLVGQSGTGKSTFLKALRESIDYPTTYISHLEDMEELSTFDQNSPLVLYFDDVDLWLSIREFPFTDRCFMIRKLLDEWKNRKIVFVLSTSDEKCIADYLKCPNYIYETITLPMPKKSIERLRILEYFLGPKYNFLEEIAGRTRGYSPRDLRNLVNMVEAHCFVNNAPITLSDFQMCLKDYQPRFTNVHGPPPEIPVVRWDDIGGQAEAKKCLKDCVKWLTTHASTLKKFNIRPPRGILLHGPPGSGKTMLAKALANECQMQFIPIKGPELLSKWVGDSEKAIRNLFARARQQAPSVLFFDEFDALCGCRSSWGAGNRVISQMLHELDGFRSTDDAEDHILVVAATNRPDMIDQALLRPGRFDHKIHIAPPNLEDRIEILRMTLRIVEPPISQEIIHKLGVEMDGFSGAEVVAICSDASMLALQKDINADTLSEVELFTALRDFKANRKAEWVSHI